MWRELGWNVSSSADSADGDFNSNDFDASLQAFKPWWKLAADGATRPDRALGHRFYPFGAKPPMPG
jgi:triphosphoribosyl-dephospho-CoA synthetase